MDTITTSSAIVRWSYNGNVSFTITVSVSSGSNQTLTSSLRMITLSGTIYSHTVTIITVWLPCTMYDYSDYHYCLVSDYHVQSHSVYNYSDLSLPETVLRPAGIV